MPANLYTLQEGPTDGSFIITKYDSLGLEMISQYEMPDAVTCTCPASFRESCRHREMLPLMLDRIDTHWFYDFDNGQWQRLVDGKMTAEPTGKRLTVADLPQPEAPVEGDGVAQAYSTILGEKVTAVHEGVPIVERGFRRRV